MIAQAVSDLSMLLDRSVSYDTFLDGFSVFEKLIPAATMEAVMNTVIQARDDATQPQFPCPALRRLLDPLADESPDLGNWWSRFLNRFECLFRLITMCTYKRDPHALSSGRFSLFVLPVHLPPRHLLKILPPVVPQLVSCHQSQCVVSLPLFSFSRRVFLPHVCVCVSHHSRRTCASCPRHWRVT